MAAGDTIGGQVRVQRETQHGDLLRVLGPLSQDEADQATLNQRVFVNVQAGVDAPFGAANIHPAPAAVFQPGEALIVQHLSASLAEAIDVGDDEYQIKVLEKDLNTGVVTPRTLTVADNEITTDPTSSTTAWTSFFQATVPDRRRWIMKGYFQAAATETA